MLRSDALHRRARTRAAACRCHRARRRVRLGSNAQALIEGLHARFLDGFLRKRRGCDCRGQNSRRTEKFEIGHGRLPSRYGPFARCARVSDGKTRFCLVIFLSAQNREVAFRLSSSLRNFLRCHSAPITRARGCRSMRRANWARVSLCANILLPQTIYISRWQPSPHASLVYDGRSGRVGLVFDVLRFRSDSLRLEWS
jgi:hypothetical protein